MVCVILRHMWRRTPFLLAERGKHHLWSIHTAKMRSPGLTTTTISSYDGWLHFRSLFFALLINIYVKIQKMFYFSFVEIMFHI